MSERIKTEFNDLISRIKQNPVHIIRMKEKMRELQIKQSGLSGEEFEKLSKEELRKLYKTLELKYSEHTCFEDDEIITVSLDYVTELWGNNKLPLDIRRENHLKFGSHTHDFFEMAYVYSGDCYCGIDGEEHLLEPGTICLYNTQVRHSMLVGDKTTNLINILVRKSCFNSVLLPMLKNINLFFNFFINSIYNANERPTYMQFHVAEGSRLQLYLYDIVKEYVEKDSYSQQNMLFSFCSVLIELSRQYQDIDPEMNSAIQKPGIEQIISFISDNCANITLEELAQRFHYSSGYISKLITEKSGKSFSQLVYEFKMIKSTTLLKNTDFDLSKISQMLGYAERSSFEKAFKKYHLLTPSQYRKNHIKLHK